MTSARIFTSLIGEELLLYCCDWTKMVTGKKGQKKSWNRSQRRLNDKSIGMRIRDSEAM